MQSSDSSKMLSSNNAKNEFLTACAALKNVNGAQIPELPFGEWNLYELADDCTKVYNKYGKFRVIEKKIDAASTTKPTLVVMAGYSLKSFCGSAQIIMGNLHLLVRKYKAIYIICYESFDGFSDNAAKERDVQRGKSAAENSALTKPIDSLEYREFVFGGPKGEIEMYTELGAIVDKVIRCLGLTNVHLLGKSAGGGTAMNIVYTNPIYKRLYLAVPAHPTYCKSLEKLGARLNEMKVIIGWNENDDRNLAGVPSNKNMELFEPILASLKAKYPGFQYQQHRFTPGNFHEINPKLLELIAADK
jgi:hypothetical protein